MSWLIVAAKTLVGKKFGRYLVIGVLRQSWKRQIRLLCVCDCGHVRKIIRRDLVNGRTTSCGCARASLTAKNKTTHGESRSPEYLVFQGMKRRCLDRNHISYPNYGGRGVMIWPGWIEKGGFVHFLAHIGRRPSKFHSLDRFPNQNGNYEPGNVRWATDIEQGRNKSNNRILTVGGKSKCLAEWAVITGINRETIAMRIDSSGWPEEAAVTTPVIGRGRRPKPKK